MENFTKKNNPFSKDISFEKGFFNYNGTYVHPTSIVDKNVELGENVKIGPFCTIVGKTKIDSGSRIHGYVSMGMPAQDVNATQPLGSIEIGKNTEIREFVTISSPKIPDAKTIIGNNCYVMNFSHIAHDVIMEDNVVLINNVNLGGHVYVEHHAMLMANTALHQYCRVGAYSALTPFSAMRQDLPPFCMFDGKPGRFAGLNLVALKRAGLSAGEMRGIKTVTKLYFQEKLPSDTILQMIEEDDSLKNNPFVLQFINFIKNCSRGVTRKTINDV